MKFQRPLATAVLSLAICVSVVAQNTVFQARVIQVVDGTTVVVETQSKSQFHVRCLGAAAPSEQESFGVESKQRLSASVLGETVTIEYTKKDENGNLLGSIRLNNQDVCLDQIRLGLAWLDPDAAAKLSSSERRLYATAESVARVNTVGIWTARTQAQREAGPVGNAIEQSTSTTSSANTQPSGDSTSVTTANTIGSTVDVRGYFRKDGTYVPPHKRTAPDGSFDDNWSTVGNVNPYTGQPGKKSWLRRNWWIFPTVGALIGAGYLAHRYSSNTGGGGIVCRDGWISQAQNRQGACSHHGGIR